MAQSTEREVENLRSIAKADRYELQKALLFLSAKHPDIVGSALSDAMAARRRTL